MSTFDAEVFAVTVLVDVREILNSYLRVPAETSMEVSELQQDIEATMMALEIERDGRRAQALRDDLVRFLPARKAAILASVPHITVLHSTALSQALELACRATLIAAKAFICNDERSS